MLTGSLRTDSNEQYHFELRARPHTFPLSDGTGLYAVNIQTWTYEGDTRRQMLDWQGDMASMR